jgi:hypothetical protein
MVGGLIAFVYCSMAGAFYALAGTQIDTHNLIQ